MGWTIKKNRYVFGRLRDDPWNISALVRVSRDPVTLKINMTQIGTYNDLSIERYDKFDVQWCHFLIRNEIGYGYHFGFIMACY